MAKSIKPKKYKAISNRRILTPKMYGYLSLALIISLLYYFTLASNLSFKSQKYFLVVTPNTSVEKLANTLSSKGIIKNKYTFKAIAKAMQWKQVNSGMYEIQKGWGNVHLISYLQNTTPFKYRQLQVRSYRNRSNIIRHICKQANLNFKQFYESLNDVPLLKSLGFSKESIFVIFLPNKYEVPVNTTAKQILEILTSHFEQYWTDEKMEALSNSRLDPIKATVLSTIVFAETKNIFEMPIIAGVYINRLNRGMRLESDPTLVFAKGDFSMKRIYRKHTQQDSDYNTYRKKGLPPGPIGVINHAAIEAVVNYTEHDYIFFCANQNLNGTHLYSETYHEHKQHAARYRGALNKHKVK